MSKTLRALLAGPSDDDVSDMGEWRYQLELPSMADHRNHFTVDQSEACIVLTIDESIAVKYNNILRGYPSLLSAFEGSFFIPRQFVTKALQCES